MTADESSFGNKKNRLNLFALFFTVLLNAIGFGIIVPVVPGLLSQISGTNISESARYAGHLLFIFALCQFLFMPLFGYLSDRFGRKKILLISLCALVVDYYVMATAQSLMALYFARAVAGIFGAASVVIAAYIGDLFSGTKRAKYFGYLGAFAGVGMMLGPAIGGVCAEVTIRMPFYVSAWLLMLNLVFVQFFVREPVHPKKNELKPPLSSLIPASFFKGLNKQNEARPLLLVYFIMLVVQTSYMAVFAFVTIFKFGWSPLELGICLIAFGFGNIIGQGFIVTRAVDLLGLDRSISFGILFYLIGFFLIGFAPSPFFVYLAIPASALAGVFGATIVTKISMFGDKSEQGQIQGTLGSIRGLSLMIGPVIMTETFRLATTSPSIKFPAFIAGGTPFIICGILSIIAYLILLRTNQ